MDIPIFRKTYELYKVFYVLRNSVPKQDRHALWQKIEQTTLTILEQLLLASERGKESKQPPLEQASVQLNLLRILLRLAKDTKVMDLKKYAQTEQTVDEIGRMLGGWIKTLRNSHTRPPPQRNF